MSGSKSPTGWVVHTHEPSSLTSGSLGAGDKTWYFWAHQRKVLYAKRPRRGPGSQYIAQRKCRSLLKVIPGTKPQQSTWSYFLFVFIHKPQYNFFFSAWINLFILLISHFQGLIFNSHSSRILRWGFALFLWTSSTFFLGLFVFHPMEPELIVMWVLVSIWVQEI